MVNEDKHWENWTNIRETSSVPGDTPCLQWVEQRASEAVIPDSSRGTAARSGNLTKKGLTCKKDALSETRTKTNGRLLRKYSTIQDWLFSSKNIITVEEKMKQFNDLFKILLDVHQENNQLLGNDERCRDDNWFDDVDT